MRYGVRCGVVLVLGLMLASAAWAQWSSDPAKNLALADKGNGNDQVQPKVRPLAHNGWYVSWFDSDPNSPPPVGYDVYLQRLNAGGVEQFRHDGIQVAHLSNSSTEDYGLDADTQGNALLAFLDTREGSNQQVTAAKMGPAGKALWGKLGVQLTHGSSASNAAPKIAGTSDGSIVVAWTSNSNVVLQKLDANGHPLWGKGVVLKESGYNYGLADLHAADNGSVIVSWTRDHGFGTDRYLYANKLSPSGQLLWGKGHVHVLDSGSLQFGNFPYFVPDGNGGAVFSWYTSSPALQCFAQHILADGSEAFPHNGSAASTNTSQVRVSPAGSYRATTDEVFLFWTEADSNQLLNGVYAQKFDGTGTRKWGDSGLVVVALGADLQIFVQNVQIGDGALAFWVDQVGLGNATIQATRLNRQGKVVCQQFPVSSLPANKARLASDIASSGLSAVAFEDDRIGNNGIYIQNVNRNCSLGQQLPR
jgi:hypothetical protein